MKFGRCPPVIEAKSHRTVEPGRRDAHGIEHVLHAFAEGRHLPLAARVRRSEPSISSLSRHHITTQAACRRSPAWLQASNWLGIAVHLRHCRATARRRLRHQIRHQTAARVCSGELKALPCRTLQCPFDQGHHHVPGIVPLAGCRSDSVQPTQPGRCAAHCRVDLAGGGGGRAMVGIRPGAAVALVLRPQGLNPGPR